MELFEIPSKFFFQPSYKLVWVNPQSEPARVLGELGPKVVGPNLPKTGQPVSRKYALCIEACLLDLMD